MENEIRNWMSGLRELQVFEGTVPLKWGKAGGSLVRLVQRVGRESTVRLLHIGH